MVTGFVLMSMKKHSLAAKMMLKTMLLESNDLIIIIVDNFIIK
jgi:hypothetical protein